MVVPAAVLAQAPISSGKAVRPIGVARLRAESWDWFPSAAPADGTYPLASGFVRLGVAVAQPRWDVVLEGEAPFLIGVPSNAVGPAPQGQLGFGGATWAANDDTRVTAFLKQGYLRYHGAAAKPWSVRAGRFEFGDGREAPAPDPAIASLRQARVADRLIGNFAFSPVGRSFDGAELGLPVGGAHGAVALLRPTAGVFNLEGMPELPVDVAYASLTAGVGLAPGVHRDEVRLFGMYYADRRDVPKADNRPGAIRAADHERIRVTTIGGHYLAVAPVGRGRADFVAWGAWQRGDWGRLNHAASAVALEAGYRPGNAPTTPWFRLGVFRGSGDHDPGDGTHGSFFQVLPTPRIYARFPFYNMMNLTEAFLSARLEPHKALTLQGEFHLLRLSAREDLWYAGGGAFDEETFGFGGRPSGGERELARLLDLSVDYRFSPHSSATLYLAHAFGRAVVETSYPDGGSATYAYLELQQRF